METGASPGHTFYNFPNTGKSNTSTPYQPHNIRSAGAQPKGITAELEKGLAGGLVALFVLILIVIVSVRKYYRRRLPKAFEEVFEGKPELDAALTIFPVPEISTNDEHVRHFIDGKSLARVLHGQEVVEIANGGEHEWRGYELEGSVSPLRESEEGSERTAGEPSL